MDELEKWAPLPGHEKNYEISTHGNVRHTLWRKDGVLRNLKPFYNKGYPYISVRVGKKNKKIAIHRHVLMAFDRMPFGGEESCHNDGNPGNVHLSNLRWDSHIGNEADKTKHGTSVKGERNGAAKIVESDAREILYLLRSGWKQQNVADKYGISQSAVSLINIGKNWSHIRYD